MTLIVSACGQQATYLMTRAIFKVAKYNHTIILNSITSTLPADFFQQSHRAEKRIASVGSFSNWLGIEICVQKNYILAQKRMACESQVCGHSCTYKLVNSLPPVGGRNVFSP